MKINITPNLDQIRFFANAAIHEFDFQSPEAAQEGVICDMRALLAYLEAFDNGNGIAVARVVKIESGIKIERSSRSGDIFDLKDRHMVGEAALEQSSESNSISDGFVKHVWTKHDRDTQDRKGNLLPVEDSGAQQ